MDAAGQLVHLVEQDDGVASAGPPHGLDVGVGIFTNLSNSMNCYDFIAKFNKGSPNYLFNHPKV